MLECRLVPNEVDQRSLLPEITSRSDNGGWETLSDQADPVALSHECLINTS